MKPKFQLAWVSTKWKKAKSRSVEANRPILLLLVEYANRRITRQLRQIVLVINPNFDSMRWKNRSRQESLEGYFISRSSPSNSYLWDRLDLSTMNSFLELGSNSGNRLIEIASRFPNKTFVGVDINNSAVTLGNEWVVSHGIENLEFMHADITSPEFYLSLRNRKFDCVVTWATLIYVHPLRIGKLLQFIAEITSKRIVLIEQNDPHLQRFPKYLGVPVRHEPTWVRNYQKIFSVINVDRSLDLKLIPVPREIWLPGGGWRSG